MTAEMREGGGARIAQATPADARVVAQLLREFNAEFDTPAPPLETLTRRFAALLSLDDAAVFLALDARGEDESGEGGSGEGRPIGFAYLTLRPSPYYDGPIALLEELYVAPGLRGRGIGSLLMGEMHRFLAERGCGEIQINVDAVDADARRFYERHGFSNFETGQDYRMLCYIKEL